MMVHSVQVCQGNEVIAFLQETNHGDNRWFVYIPGLNGASEVVDNPDEVQQLYRVITDPGFSGYMVFRAREYEDVVVAVVL